MRVTRAGDALRISRRWFHPLAFLTVVTLIPLLIWCGVTGRAGAFVPAGYAPLVNVVITASGVSCVYLLGLVLLNSTTVEITADRVALSHGPLPWFLPRRVVDARMITRVFCVEHTVAIDMNVRDCDYELKAFLRSDECVSLLEDIPDRKQAEYLQQAITHRLGILDNGARTD